MIDILSYTVEEHDNQMRIDKLISEQFDTLSRSYIQKLIKENAVLVDEHSVKANYKVSPGEIVSIQLPEPIAPDIKPENIPLDIVYEDDDIILVNKGKGMVVHPAAGHYTGTIVNALLSHCSGNLSGINGVMRPGIVHRIDMDTTGIIIVCKNDFAHNHIAEQLKNHTITRKYHAIVHNSFQEEGGSIDKPIGRHPVHRKKMAADVKNGKRAVTHYQVLENYKNYAYIECMLETGRTHQIRVHMASIHHPLVGDEVYGPAKPKFQTEGQVLHAKVLGFIHPRSGEYMEFETDLPAYFQELIEKLRKYQ